VVSDNVVKTGLRKNSLWFQPDLIVDRVPQPLFTPEVSLGRCYGNMAEQELDLF